MLQFTDRNMYPALNTKSFVPSKNSTPVFGEKVALIPSKRHARVEVVHHRFSEAPHLMSAIPHPKNGSWRGENVVPDDESHMA